MFLPISTLICFHERKSNELVDTTSHLIKVPREEVGEGWRKGTENIILDYLAIFTKISLDKNWLLWRSPEVPPLIV